LMQCHLKRAQRFKQRFGVHCNVLRVNRTRKPPRCRCGGGRVAVAGESESA
jgi:hypothetical protein